MACTEKTGGTSEEKLARQREQMTRLQIRKRGIDDPRILEAFLRVPRHLFVPVQLRPQAYQDTPLPIGENQTISQPYMVALMTQLLDPQPEDVVLEIGSGSGYQSAILAYLVKRVISVERLPSLARMARKNLKAAGIETVEILLGDASAGAIPFPSSLHKESRQKEESDPLGNQDASYSLDDADHRNHQGGQTLQFDKIIITAGTPSLAAGFIPLLKEQGRLVAPVGTLQLQELCLYTKIAGGLHETRQAPCRFVPLLGEGGWPEG